MLMDLCLMRLCNAVECARPAGAFVHVRAHMYTGFEYSCVDPSISSSCFVNSASVRVLRHCARRFAARVRSRFFVCNDHFATMLAEHQRAIPLLALLHGAQYGQNALPQYVGCSQRLGKLRKKQGELTALNAKHTYNRESKRAASALNSTRYQHHRGRLRNSRGRHARKRALQKCNQDIEHTLFRRRRFFRTIWLAKVLGHAGLS